MHYCKGKTREKMMEKDSKIIAFYLLKSWQFTQALFLIVTDFDLQINLAIGYQNAYITYNDFSLNEGLDATFKTSRPHDLYLNDALDPAFKTSLLPDFSLNDGWDVAFKTSRPREARSDLLTVNA